jgi:hypothetical protein
MLRSTFIAGNYGMERKRRFSDLESWEAGRFEFREPHNPPIAEYCFARPWNQALARA